MKQREIKFSLIYRDMWQSSGKYQPRKDQLERIAPVLVEMGCFARVETNGGAFERTSPDVQGQEGSGRRHHSYLRRT